MVLAVGVDVGGTFTDIVVLDPSGIRAWKTPTTQPQSTAVTSALGEIGLGSDTQFLHGTTVATNALLEGRGAAVVLVTNPGFEDLIEIGRQKRPSLYDTSADRPEPLVPRTHRIGHVDIDKTMAKINGLAPDSIAVSLVGAYKNPEVEVEAEVGRSLRSVLKGVSVSLGSEVSPGFREFERVATTVINAYLTPRVAGYLDDLTAQLAIPGASAMTSSGGLLPFEAAKGAVGQLTLSGPAGGVVATEALRLSHDLGSVIGFDMGGTSTDVCRVDSDGIVLSSSQIIGGRVNRVPSMPIHTVGAGGGSVAWRDSGGSLRVGPVSSGADPGPAGYGLGGTNATVTDANLFLGYIPEESEFSGGLLMDVSLATQALARLGAELGLSAQATATGIIEVVDAHVERALRTVSVEEGFDPRESVLIAYGGAGGLHASRLGRNLGMRSVLIPPHAGVFSALGLLMARPRTEVLETVLAPAGSELVAAAANRLKKVVADRFCLLHNETPEEVSLTIDARYLGQSHELTLDYRKDEIAAHFARSHQARFGFHLEDEDVEVVNIRAAAFGHPPTDWKTVVRPTSGYPRSRPALLTVGRDRIEAPVWQRPTLPTGFEVVGPAVVVDGLSSTLINSGELAAVLDDGTLEISW